MPLELYLAGILLAALLLYVVLGGADFGGGVWDLLARGPRADEQRRLIARAIGPIWEANHVWLIAVLVLLFSCFPRAYALLADRLHVPFTILLVGIVLRGSAFVFRTYDTQRQEVFQAWSRVFAIASLVAPFMLGVSLGAVVDGDLVIPDDPTFAEAFVWTWLAPFPIAVGVFVVVVFAFLAAVYLMHAADDDAIADAFRTRALGSAGAVTVLAWVVFGLARPDGRLRLGLWTSWWAPGFHLATAAIGAALLWALWARRSGLARALAVTQVAAVVGGFGAALYPYLVVPILTVHDAAAPDEVLEVVAIGMTLGLIAIAPFYGWLLRVFHDPAPTPGSG